ncbi:universal stress protein [Myceligenerans xiligouense]|uniref:Universal stress protein family protein n=1 Tax=Myceligenerans xiligouense TaxID=253184 RepID=A0A3N4Z7L1_9MICO|nr:universal stress protein [Myceligenerans xiligouense]RPF21838.1 universal stress protein family protein [Myceligenerans xiligouense]
MTTAQRPAPVVVAVDGTDRSAGAIRYAMGEARLRGSAVRLVHVLGEAGDDGRESVDRALSEAGAAGPDVEVGFLLGQGERVTGLVTAAASAGLLVLGRLARRATGPTTAGVAARAEVPVAVVPADWRDRAHGRVVAGVKSSAISGELLAYAFRTASARGAALRVVHVVDVPDQVEELAEVDAGTRPADPVLEAMVRDWSGAFPDVAVTTSVVRSDPVRALVEAGADADVLLVARHPRGLRHPVRLGPVPRALLERSDIPVEVFPLTGEPATPPLVLERAGAIVKE